MTKDIKSTCFAVAVLAMMLACAACIFAPSSDATAEDNEQILIPAVFAGATQVTIDWGDETAVTQYTPTINTAVHALEHTYMEAGKYTITITATTVDGGEMVTKLYYDTETGKWASDGNFRSGLVDNYIVTALVIFAIVALIAGVFWDKRLLAAAAVLFIAALVCWFGGWTRF